VRHKVFIMTVTQDRFKNVFASTHFVSCDTPCARSFGRVRRRPGYIGREHTL
jgi:hypothetical protein